MESGFADQSPRQMPQCPMDSILRLLMGPWTTYIVWLLQRNERLRFGEIRAEMPQISSKVLTERLRMLEEARLIHRDYRPTVPPTVYYSLTPRGHELRGALDGLHQVALRWAAEDAAAMAAAEDALP